MRSVPVGYSEIQVPDPATSLRTASLTDAEAITALINVAFQVERFFLDGDRIGLPEVCERFETGRFIVAEDEAGMSGCVYIELRGARAYLGLLSIAPERQRSGLGTLLTSAAEEFCRAYGCQAVDLLIVNLRKELPGYYRRLGYVENGTAPFPAGVQPKQPCHFLKMSKPLRVEDGSRNKTWH